MFYELFWVTAKLSIFSPRRLHELLLQSTVWNDSAFSFSAIRTATNVQTHLGTGGSSFLLHLCSLLKTAALGFCTAPSRQPGELNLFMHTQVLSFQTECGLFFLLSALGIHYKKKSLQYKDSGNILWITDNALVRCIDQEYNKTLISLCFIFWRPSSKDQ